MDSVMEATGDNYHDLVGSPGWVLVDFWGPRCEPCLRLAPYVKSLPEVIPDLHIVTVEAPKARRLCIEQKISGLPTFVLYRDGLELGRLSDNSMKQPQLDSWLEGHLGFAYS